MDISRKRAADINNISTCHNVMDISRKRAADINNMQY